MKLVYKHQVTIVSIPAGIKVGTVTSREGAYLVTVSTDPEIKAPSIIQLGSAVFDRFNIQQEYNGYYPWYYLNQNQGQNYPGTQIYCSNGTSVVDAQSAGQNSAVLTIQNAVSMKDPNFSLEEIQNEVDKLVSPSSDV